MAANRRKILVPLATLVAAASVAVGSGASFTSTTASTTAVTSGSVTHASDTTSLAITNIKDKDVIRGSVTITNTGSLTANGSGVWTLDHSATSLSGGTYALTAVATESAGVTATATQSITVDLTAPAVAIGGITSDSGASGADFVTNDSSLVFSGTAEANSAVLVTLMDADGASVFSVTVSADGSGTYAEVTWQRLKSTGMALSNITMFGFIVFGMFLLGAWFVRSGAIARPREFPRFYAWLRWGALPLGLLAMLGSLALSPTMDFATFSLRLSTAFALQMTANLLMCLGYLAWILKALQAPVFERALSVLAPAGRMALTNYLLQSLVCTWIFYGYGLGYFEQLPRAWHPLFALVLFGGQVLLSHAWLSRFRFGPMEWLWRSLTYASPQPMRLQAR